jgi:hypothetical protein
LIFSKYKFNLLALSVMMVVCRFLNMIRISNRGNNVSINVVLILFRIIVLCVVLEERIFHKLREIVKSWICNYCESRNATRKHSFIQQLRLNDSHVNPWYGYHVERQWKVICSLFIQKSTLTASCLWDICHLILSGLFNWKIVISAGWRWSLMVMATPLYFELLITCDVTSVCNKGPYT